MKVNCGCRLVTCEYCYPKEGVFIKGVTAEEIKRARNFLFSTNWGDSSAQRSRDISIATLDAILAQLSPKEAGGEDFCREKDCWVHGEEPIYNPYQHLSREDMQAIPLATRGGQEQEKFFAHLNNGEVKIAEVPQYRRRNVYEHEWEITISPKGDIA